MGEGREESREGEIEKMDSPFNTLVQDPYVFWVVTGLMFTGCGLLWRRLLTFLGKNLDRPPIKRLGPKPPTKST